MATELHKAARVLAQRGLAVFPCAPRGKVPAVAHGVLEATTDPAVIDEWWRLLPDANIGIATGKISGCFVVDIDADLGEQALRALETAHCALPPTVEVITGKGRHCYFRYTRPVGCGVRRLPDVDLRGDGGYVIAPPSIHETGRRYEWSVDTTSVMADAPGWLYEALEKPQGAKPAREWVAAVTIVEGARNDTLASVTGHLFRHNVSPLLAAALVEAYNATYCSPPLPDDEVQRTINSIAEKECQRRGLADG